MIRLGLCCKFRDAAIRFRSTTVTYLKRIPDPLTYLNTIIRHNVESLEKALLYCQIHKIGCFRIGSDFMPAITHPDLTYSLEDLPEGNLLKIRLRTCGQIAKRAGIRLTLHPDQFVVLNSPKKAVVAQSLASLEYHAFLADLVSADVINIHGGGKYGNKIAALDRFAENFMQLSDIAKMRLTIENDDKVYTPSDLLPLCQQLNIPLVYDVHHHRCLPDSLSIAEATDAALTTWNREPLFHLSSPKEGWNGPKPNRHHDFIIEEDIPICWKKILRLTVEIEAKAKEKAVMALYQKLQEQKWSLFPK